MIYVVATLTVKPETRAEFIAAATACIKGDAQGEGQYRLRPARKRHRSRQDGVRRAVGEMEALGPHRGAEHMKTFGRVAVKCVDGAAEDRIDHAGKGRGPLIKKNKGANP